MTVSSKVEVSEPYHTQEWHLVDKSLDRQQSTVINTYIGRRKFYRYQISKGEAHNDYHNPN